METTGLRPYRTVLYIQDECVYIYLENQIVSNRNANYIPWQQHVMEFIFSFLYCHSIIIPFHLRIVAVTKSFFIVLSTYLYFESPQFLRSFEWLRLVVLLLSLCTQLLISTLVTYILSVFFHYICCQGDNGKWATSEHASQECKWSREQWVKWWWDE